MKQGPSIKPHPSRQYSEDRVMEILKLHKWNMRMLTLMYEGLEKENRRLKRALKEASRP